MIPRLMSLFAFCLLLASPAPAQDLPHSWSESYGDSYEQRVESVSVDDSGNIIIAGYFANSVNLGGGTLYSSGGYDIFLAKFDPDGSHLWSRKFGTIGDQKAFSVDVLSSGYILLGGCFETSIDFGAGNHVSAGGYDAFVAKFTPGGVTYWSNSYGDASHDFCRAVGNGNGGMTYLVGDFAGSINLGGGALTSAGGFDLWVAMLDGSSGTHLWSRRFGDSNDQFAFGLTGHPQGPVAITGYTYGSIDFGGGPLPYGGGADAFIASFDFLGAYRWSRMMGDASSQYGMAVAFHNGSMSVVATGQFLGSVDAGGGIMTSAGSVDIYLAEYSASGGHLWSRRFGGAGADYPRSVSTDLFGNIALAGFFEGTSQFGGDFLVSAGSFDAFVSTYDTDGNHSTSQRAGDSGEQNGLDLFYEDDGDIVMVGKFEGSVDWGGGPLVSAGDFDIFLVKFGSTTDIINDIPSDTRLHFRAFPSPGARSANIVYSLPRSGSVRLDAHDIQGRWLGTLVDGYQQAGEHMVALSAGAGDGLPMSSGVILLRLITGEESRVCKIVFVK
ncbi:MAG: hypothetical protein KJ970_04670 [Candidatus Eisenbacteria bacterium]|uniref:T9SS type A sorting domain-containing protein n=1 Tax=Eiseniibacteriota bacterium TaxID=2212470 RepID=A0A948RSI8_UNCEI|nr:hypothetical protein [Candidatus Eisenbacteria bacterium]MBU1950698.1 hypothetical protein [Candidatus Eisenbacteria bacterium]MBU2690200.1 hypothetical protein [Candidatus Eisenbacteria bacterium]